ncbi:hypothetical protein [Cryobacterium sp. BB307]|uniref:hypothetical protein n=1 Tax=Cryobacterium sp. BB307 TaxID=2716317 RepID=UPI001445E524|nr:hypothetical protein [Cryobacterium sp. BB307]
MLERYADGETLEAIAADNGMTRERVRQIVRALGGPAAEQSREKRRAAKESAESAARQEFLGRFEVAATSLAHRGFSRPETIARLKALFPEIVDQVADDALASSKIIFDRATADNRFSDAALMAGLWYLLASELSLAPDYMWAAMHLDEDVVSDLRPVLEDATVSDRDVATILGLIGAAQRYAAEHPAITITGARYGELRLELIEALGLVSEKGATPWPPTHQTIIKRFGGWNQAMLAMGIATANRGRSKGLVQFKESDYENALVDFCEYAEVSSTSLSFANYELWARTETDQGNRRPSGASIRNVYGNWLDALRTVRQRASGGGSTATEIAASAVS